MIQCWLVTLIWMMLVKLAPADVEHSHVLLCQLLNAACVVEGVRVIQASGVIQKLLQGAEVYDDFEGVASAASIPST